MLYEYIDTFLTIIFWISFIGLLISLINPMFIKNMFRLQSFSRNRGALIFVIAIIIVAFLGGANDEVSTNKNNEAPDQVSSDQKYTEQLSVADCEIWGEGAEYARCAIDIMKRDPKNINVCFDILETDRKILKDYSRCITNSDPSDPCNIQLLDGGHMYWIGRTVYAECLRIAHEEAGDSVCNSSESIELKDSCLSNLAQKIGDHELCKDMSDPELTEKCENGFSF